ncbi:MAG: hypothetical protein BWX63_02467 [Bacteroidetes bacterium ADurb.Bin041]|nr:MAG: hypothetical protein BWX63_02467 [Bacteroidetes bacterium ADurb.Bin041]
MQIISFLLSPEGQRNFQNGNDKTYLWFTHYFVAEMFLLTIFTCFPNYHQPLAFTHTTEL